MAQNEKSGSDLDIFEGLGKKSPSVPPPNGARSVPPPPPPTGRPVPLEGKRTLLGMTAPAGDAVPRSALRALPPPPPGRGTLPPVVAPPAARTSSIPPPPPASVTKPANANASPSVDMDWDEEDEATHIFDEQSESTHIFDEEAEPGDEDRRPVSVAAAPRRGSPEGQDDAPRASRRRPRLRRSPRFRRRKASARQVVAAPAPAPRIGRSVPGGGSGRVSSGSPASPAELPAASHDQPVSAGPGDHAGPRLRSRARARCRPRGRRRTSRCPSFRFLALPPCRISCPAQRRAMEATAHGAAAAEPHDALRGAGRRGRRRHRRRAVLAVAPGPHRHQRDRRAGRRRSTTSRSSSTGASSATPRPASSIRWPPGRTT